MVSGLKILTFGGLEIQDGEKPVTGLASRKTELLLVYLVRQGRGYTREVLAELLWAGRSQSQSLANLRVVLSSLRKQLGEYVRIERDWVGLREEVEVWLDAGELETVLGGLGDPEGPFTPSQVEQVKRVVGLYRGAFLEGVYVQEAEGLTGWMEQEREHLQGLMVRGLSWLAGWCLQSGEYQEGIGYARRLVELDPLQEAGQRQLMRLLALDGQRGAAMSQYERFRQVLAQELGAEPDAKTLQLHAQIQSGDGGERIVSREAPSDILSSGEARLRRHNLPAHQNSFVGRERERGEIKSLFASSQLLTLTGIGGTGKTRLALQVAEELIELFPDGVWLVELAPLRDPGLVEQTTALVLKVSEKPDRLLSDILIEDVRDKDMLIVLDNCEHLVDACARLVDQLLRAAPNLKILCTSRAPMNLTGEITYPVQPLTLPDSNQAATPHALMQSEAGQLFGERAAAVKPEFHMTEENAAAIAYICQHLDGIPLAIELAATRVRHISVEQIASRLGDRFLLLTGGSRTALPRQQTLRAALDWSYELLTEAESHLFRRLSVFNGRFSLEAVEAVCSDDREPGSTGYLIRGTQILDLLSALVDHSLVRVDQWNDEALYDLLETVRGYVLEKLHELGKLPAMGSKHMQYYLELAVRAHPYIRKGQPEWMRRLEAECDNLHAAMEFAIANDLESAIRFEYLLSYFYTFTNRKKEMAGWTIRILTLSEDWPRGKLRAKVLYCAGDCAVLSHDFEQGQVLLEASLEMAKEFGDQEIVNAVIQSFTGISYFQGDWKSMHDYAAQHLEISKKLCDNYGIGDSLWQLGHSASKMGKIKEAHDYLEQSLHLARQENDVNLIAFNLASLAWLARQEGDTNAAKSYCMERADIRRQMGYKNGLASAWIDWGEVLLQEGDFRQARMMARNSMMILQEIKILNIQIICLELFAGAAGVEGQDECAARLFGASESAAEKYALIEDFDRLTYDPILNAVNKRLGEVEFRAAWEAGRKMTLEEAVEYAMQSE